MNLLDQQLKRLDDEHRARRDGLISAAGLLAEAETLAIVINEALPVPYTRAAVPCITSYDDGGINVRILILDRHAELRPALHRLGLVAVSETPVGPYRDRDGTTSTIRLAGFDVPLHMYREPAGAALEAA